MPHVETKETMVRSSGAAITRWVGRLRSDVHGGTATEYAVLLASFVLGSVLLIAGKRPRQPLLTGRLS
jgi:Flp pilus assembly pilin Flp